jgi:trimethylamine--corrinoid protein Co-methyltransferase
MFVNTMPRYEILSEDAMDVLDRGWRRIVSELGVEFLLPEAVEVLRAAGQDVVDEHLVRLDPEFVLEQVAKAPREFDVQARNPDRTLHIGGDSMAFAPVYGCPFVREGEVRRDGTMADFDNFVRLAQHFDELDCGGGTVVEPNDRPLDSRHLDMVLALQTLSDKPYMGSVTSGPNAADTIRMSEILFGGREAIERSPASISLINVNSPLRFDDRMLAAMLEYCKANQAVIITPFLLMGAMSPVSIPATLVQQMAEALAGIALAQLVRPGCPIVFGSFLSNTDMQSGSPSFGTPESAIGLLCTGQIARRYGLPFRTGGALNASQTVDAQAAYEALMTLLPTFLAGTNFVMHAAGWLEGGLVSCYEKFIVDIELLRELRHEFQPLEVDEESLAFGAHQEVGAGGHFLGAAHTLERFRECFYRPLLSSTENFDRWTRNGGLDATARAAHLWREALAQYEPPPLDDGVRAELEQYVTRRRVELGDAEAVS